MNLSINIAINTPDNKKIIEKITPLSLPLDLLRVSSADINKSVKETVIITPAENAKANVISFLLSPLEKNTIKAPITVDIPAISESNSGIKE
ncbi:hypothetical protein UT300007_09420 [Clostridium sp. CTA-7]